MLRPFRLDSRAVLVAALFLGVGFILWPGRRLRSENFVFYLPQGSKIVPSQMLQGTLYLPLLPVLNLSGQVTGLVEKHNSLEVWFNGSRLRFRLNRSKMRIGKRTINLLRPVLRADGEWQVPVSFLTLVLPGLSGENILYQSGTRRAFLGNVHPVSFTTSLQAKPSGAELLIQFTGKVGVRTASTNGKWVMFLNGAAVAPMERVIRFHNPYIKELRFDDHDGRPKLILVPGESGLNFYTQLTGGERVLIANVVAPQAPAAVQAQAARPPALPPPQKPGPAAPAKPAPSAPPAPVAPPLPVIVLDAGHGGADTGARSLDGILEKNLAAAMVAQTATDLQAGGKFRIVLTRVGDSDPSFSQRTVTANTSLPAAFVTFHAGELGDRSPVIAVYTYQASSPSATSGSPFFVVWNQAQEPQQAASQRLAQMLDERFSQISGAIVPPAEAVPVRQLRSIAAPAVAIEVGTLSPAMKAGAIAQPSFQQQVASAAAAALAQLSGVAPPS